MSDKLEKLGGMEGIRSLLTDGHEFGHHAIDQSWYCNECSIMALIDHVEELERQLSSQGDISKPLDDEGIPVEGAVIRRELIKALKQLQAAHKLAELVDSLIAYVIPDYDGMFVISRDSWSELKANAGELLKIKE